MLARFLPLLLSLVFLYGGCQLFTINKGKSSDDDKAKQKALCENGVEAIGLLQNEYTEPESAVPSPTFTNTTTKWRARPTPAA